MAEQRNIPADLVEIGMLARPHGIRGEIRVNYYADSLELLRGDVVYLQAGNKPPRKMEIDTDKVQKWMDLGAEMSDTVRSLMKQYAKKADA